MLRFRIEKFAAQLPGGVGADYDDSTIEDVAEEMDETSNPAQEQ